MLWAWAACVAAIVAFQFAVGGGASAFARRSDLHVQRRAQHVATGAMIFAAAGVFSPTAATSLLFGCAFVFYLLHGARKRSTRVNEMYLRQFGALLRREEIAHSVLPGAFYFLVGCGLVVLVFPHDLARLAILHLSVGDPAAALIGSMHGRKKLWSKGKTLEGFAGCLVVSATASLLVFSWQSTQSSDSLLLVRAVFAGLCAALAESIDVWSWDDNLTLPVLSALFMVCGRFTLGVI